MSHPVITSKTTLRELQEQGAKTLSDIPIEELLAYTRNQILSMAKDKTASAEIPNWEKSMALSASSIQEAIEQLNVVIGNPKIML